MGWKFGGSKSTYDKMIQALLVLKLLDENTMGGVFEADSSKKLDRFLRYVGAK